MYAAEETKVTKTEQPTAATRASLLGRPTRYTSVSPELQRERARIQALTDRGEFGRRAEARSVARAQRRQANAEEHARWASLTGALT